MKKVSTCALGHRWQTTAGEPASCPVCDSTVRDDQLADALLCYQKAVEAGRRPERVDFLCRYPDLAGELEPLLSAAQEVGKLFFPLKEAMGSASADWHDFKRTPDVDLDVPPAHPSAAAPEDGPSCTHQFAGAPTGAGGGLRRLPAAQGDVAPTVIGYELLGELGRGGMGVVYKARQLSLNRIVALKMVRAGALAREFDLTRFYEEAEVVAHLQHAHIVQVHEIGEAAGLPYLSMEYVDGGNLAQKLGGMPQVPRAAAALIETLARAVHNAHRHDIVHRDLKPANILLQEVGVGSEETGDKTSPRSSTHSPLLATDSFIPKIADFGLAKRGDTGTGMTRTGDILGTPSYMAPEQAEGKKNVGFPADIYSLGAILYEMLTGRPPFKAVTPLETFKQVIGDEPVPPRRLQPKVPRDLETICLKCLQKEPHKRYASAEALADDLARFREDRPIKARPVSRTEHAGRWCRRNPVVAGLLGTGVVGVIVAVLLLNQERTQTLINLGRAEKAERDLTEQLLKSYRDQAEARRFSRQVGQRFESLDALAKAARIARSLHLDDDVFQELRRKAIGCLALPDLRFEQELPGWSTETANYTIDDAFERCALQNKQGTISVRRVADGQEFFRIPRDVPGLLRISPDGRYLATDTPGGALTIWDLDRKEPTVTVPAGTWTGVLDFSPDSRRMVVVNADGAFGVYGLATGRVERRWLGPVRGCGSVVFHPDGRRFAAFFRGSGLIQLWSADSGQLLGELKQAGNVSTGSWSPEGRLLAVTKNDEDPLIHLWDVPNKRKVGALEGHKNRGILAAFNPAGDLVASNGYEGMLRLWDPRTGRQLLSMPDGGTPKFNRRGDRILLRPKAPQIWDIADGREYRTFVGNPARGNKCLYGGCISPDGRLLAAGSEDGAVIWEMATGNELAHLPTGCTWQALFQPSGDLMTSAGPTGVIRWPVRPNADANGAYSVGPAERLVKAVTIRVAQSKDGRIIGVAVFGCCGLLLEFGPGVFKLKSEFPHRGADNITVSSDGQWAATGGHHGTGIKVWSLLRNKLEKDLPIEGSAHSQFSPDGHWLATSSAVGLQLWKVGTWERGPTLPEGSAVFPPEGAVFGVVVNSVITLFNVDTGRTVATLEDPNHDRVSWAGFSPDGAQLVTTTNDSYAVHVWDLRRIRAGLKAIDLDWDAPDYPPAPSPQATLHPFEILGGLPR